jgi:hypothetical protein
MVNTIELAELTSGTGTFLKDFISTPIWDRRSYHPPGTRGSLICRMGSISEDIIVEGLIVASSPSDWYSAYRNMIDSWADSQGPFYIYGPNGDFYERCYMQSGSLKISNPLMATGNRNGEVFANFIAGFVDYNGNE